MIVEPQATIVEPESGDQPAARVTTRTTSDRISARFISIRLSEAAMRHWRKMTWVLLVVNALFLFWVIAASTDRASKDCAPNDQLCINASDAGTAIGVGLVIFLWFLVFIVLSLVWLMSRPRH